MFGDGSQFPEPNNRYGPELCAGADFLQRQNKTYSTGCGTLLHLCLQLDRRQGGGFDWL